MASWFESRARPGNRYGEDPPPSPLRRRDDQLMARVIGLQLAILLGQLSLIALRLA